LLPLAWLVIVTMVGGSAKIFSDDPRLGFLAHARLLTDQLASGVLPRGAADATAAARMIFNDRLDAAVAGFFMVAVIVILADSAREWVAVLRGRKPATSTEVPFEAALAAD
jgi:carbon starvation protein